MKNSKKLFLTLIFLFFNKITLSEEATNNESTKKWEGFSLKLFSGAKIGENDKVKNLTFHFNGIPLISGSGSFMVGGSAEYGLMHKNLYAGLETAFSNLSFIPIINANLGFANNYFSLGGGISLILWGINLFYRHALTTNFSLETKINFVFSTDTFSKEHDLYDSKVLYTLGLRYTI